jgi:type IV fimbrial biogenesis protein FimT
MKKFKGFTLIELMVTIAIAAILLSVGFPAMTSFLSDKKLTGQANDLIAAIRSTRGEAIKRRTTIDLEQKAGSWANGWEIQDAANTIIREGQGNNGILLGSSSAAIISFSGSGIRTNIAGDFTVKFCDDRGKGRLITITGLGGVSTVCWVGYGVSDESCSPDPGCT